MIVSLVSHLFFSLQQAAITLLATFPPYKHKQQRECVCAGRRVGGGGVYSFIPIIETRHMSFLWDYHPAVGSDRTPSRHFASSAVSIWKQLLATYAPATCLNSLKGLSEFMAAGTCVHMCSLGKGKKGRPVRLASGTATCCLAG